MHGFMKVSFNFRCQTCRKTGWHFSAKPCVRPAIL